MSTTSTGSSSRRNDPAVPLRAVCPTPREPPPSRVAPRHGGPTSDRTARGGGTRPRGSGAGRERAQRWSVDHPRAAHFATGGFFIGINSIQIPFGSSTNASFQPMSLPISRGRTRTVRTRSTDRGIGCVDLRALAGLQAPCRDTHRVDPSQRAGHARPHRSAPRDEDRLGASRSQGKSGAAGSMGSGCPGARRATVRLRGCPRACHGAFRRRGVDRPARRSRRDPGGGERAMSGRPSHWRESRATPSTERRPAVGRWP